MYEVVNRCGERQTHVGEKTKRNSLKSVPRGALGVWGSNPGPCTPHASAFAALRPVDFAGPSLRIASSSSIAASRSCTSSPAFSRSFAISRTFGIVRVASHSLVSLRSFAGSTRSGTLFAMRAIFDREGRVLDKVNRLVHAGFAALEADAEVRAATAFLRALGILEAQEPATRIEDFADAYASVGQGFLRVGRIESAQAAATQALTRNGGNGRALGLQGDILVAQDRSADALAYYDTGLRLDPKAKDLWERKGDAHMALEQRPVAIRAYMQTVNLDPDDDEGYARILALVPEDVGLWVRKGGRASAAERAGRGPGGVRPRPPDRLGSERGPRGEVARIPRRRRAAARTPMPGPRDSD